MSHTSPLEPQSPFLVMNPHYVYTFDGGKEWSECIRGSAFNKATFKKDAVIIDANCRKFQVTGAEKLGWCTHNLNGFGLANIWKRPDRRMYKFRFLVGEPIQMTFEGVKNEILDHMIERGFYRGAGGGPDLYRDKRKDLPTIEEFFRKISAGGTCPFYS
jgi:hypothetical protein